MQERVFPARDSGRLSDIFFGLVDSVMPYRNCAELPQAVRGHLPDHAQRIYIKAFNSAWAQYADPKKRREDASREETAHRVAWAAVQQVYEKGKDGRWHRMPQST